MTWMKGFLAGVLGAVLITVILSAVIYGGGFRITDFAMMWGTIIGLPMGVAAWWVGFCIHLLVGGLFGLCYAGLFKAFSGAGAFRGSLFGIGHAIVTGVVIGFVPLIDTAMESGRMLNSGPYFSREGVGGILLFFFIHIVYGATVGWIYARQVPAAREVPQRDDFRIAA